MMKRTAAVILAIMIPLCIMLSGCSSRLSEKKYNESLKTAAQNYTDGMNGYLELLLDNLNITGGFKPLESRAQPYIEKIESAFSDVKEMKPPKNYENQHKKLLKAIESEEEFVALIKELFATETKQEAQSVSERITKYDYKLSSAANGGETFAAVISEILKELNS